VAGEPQISSRASSLTRQLLQVARAKANDLIITIQEELKLEANLVDQVGNKLFEWICDESNHDDPSVGFSQ
jgi:hypothetical protein